MKIEHQACYRKRRAEAYPSMEEQLDALWHAMDAGIIPMVEKFYMDLKHVKERYPKPLADNFNQSEGA